MKIYRILSSRLKTKNQKVDEWVQKRRQVCSKCTHNSLVGEGGWSWYKGLLKTLSDFYSYITGNKEEDTLGNCMECNACSIFYKTEIEVEYCPKEKWKK